MGQITTQVREFTKQGGIFRDHKGLWWLFSGPMRWQTEPSPSHPSIYAPDFFLQNKEPWLVFEKVESASVGELQLLLENRSEGALYNQKNLRHFLTQHQQHLDWNWQPPNRQVFDAQFEELTKQFQMGKMSKAVPLTFERSPIVPTEMMLQQMLHRLLLTDDGCFPYGFWDEHQGMLGVSPEVLFRCEGKVISTTALAGTRESSLDKNLLNDQKEVLEHQLVVKDITEALQEYGAVKSGTTREWSIGSLTHLKTPIELHADHKIEFEKIVESLHPTSALGVYPRQRSWTWLKEQPEAKIRNRYGAPFGLKHPDGTSETVVAIRNFQWNDQGTLLASGCGIVCESQLESEWAELRLKRSFVKKMLEV